MSRSAKNRHITFDEISQKAQVPLDKVEFLVMKALSNGLIRGSIDQVKQIVHVNWIQPRVLSLEQVIVLSLFCVYFLKTMIFRLLSPRTELTSGERTWKKSNH